jgi:hypothetical protein
MNEIRIKGDLSFVSFHFGCVETFVTFEIVINFNVISCRSHRQWNHLNLYLYLYVSLYYRRTHNFCPNSCNRKRDNNELIFCTPDLSAQSGCKWMNEWMNRICKSGWINQLLTQHKKHAVDQQPQPRCCAMLLHTRECVARIIDLSSGQIGLVF